MNDSEIEKNLVQSFKTMGLDQINSRFHFDLNSQSPVVLKGDSIFYTCTEAHKNAHKIYMSKMLKDNDLEVRTTMKWMDNRTVSAPFSGRVTFFKNGSSYRLLIGKGTGEVEIRSSRDLKCIAQFRPSSIRC